MRLFADTIEGIKWTAGARILNEALQFALAILLMRLLGPRSYGLIGMVLVFTGFAAIFADLGLSSSLIQKKEDTEQHRSTAFWVSLALGIIIALVLSAVSHLVARFYGAPEVRVLTIAVSASFILAAPAAVPRAILQKRMRFRRLATIDTAAIVLAGVAAFSAAAAGLGVWALVIQVLARSLVSSALLLMYGNWQPQLIFSREALRELWSFGAGLTGFATVNYWARTADDLLIGRFFGSAALGLYTRAYALMLVPLAQVAGVLGTVLFPALASIQDDHARVKAAFLRAIRALTYVSFPLMLGLAVVARPFVLALFGPDWEGLVPLTRIFAISGALGSLVSPLGVIFTSQGETGKFFKLGLFSSGTVVIAILIGVSMGSVVAVAWSYLAASVLLVVPNYLVAGRLIHMKMRDLGRSVAGNAACAVAMAAFVAVVNSRLTVGLSEWIQLLLLAAAGMAAYLALSIVFKLPAFFDVASLLRFGTAGTGDEFRDDSGPPR